MAGTGSRVLTAASPCSVSCMRRTRRTTVRVVKREGVCSRTARSPVCCGRTGRGRSRSWSGERPAEARSGRLPSSPYPEAHVPRARRGAFAGRQPEGGSSAGAPPRRLLGQACAGAIDVLTPRPGARNPAEAGHYGGSPAKHRPYVESPAEAGHDAAATRRPRGVRVLYPAESSWPSLVRPSPHCSLRSSR
jgi:hypothetical protein